MDLIPTWDIGKEKIILALQRAQIASLQDQILILEEAVLEVNPSMSSDPSEELGQFLCKMANCYNQLALQKLRDGDSDEALRSLDKAEAVLRSRNVPKTRKWLVQAETSSNRSYVYKCIGSPITALFHLRKALHTETRLLHSGLYAGDHDSISTLLSICAVQSELGRHSDAVRSAQAAIKQLKRLCKGDDPRSAGAWYNLGVEYEHLRAPCKARDAFSKALELSQAISGPDHALSLTIKVALAEYHK